ACLSLTHPPSSYTIDVDEKWAGANLALQDGLIDILCKGDYPKRQNAAKSDAPVEHGKPDRNYAEPLKKRPSKTYMNHARFQLSREFSSIPVSTIFSTMATFNDYYTPTYLDLHRRILDKDPEIQKAIDQAFGVPVTELKKPGGVPPLLLRNELEYQSFYLKELSLEHERRTAPQLECGCCYCEYPYLDMTSCEGFPRAFVTSADGHLFCIECARRGAEVTIGLRKTNIACLSQDGCKYKFPRKEIQRFLTPPVYAGYLNLIQQESLDKAKEMGFIEGFEVCPFCNFGCIFSTSADEDKLFRCQNPDCSVLSCRLCKKKNHIPKSCAGVLSSPHISNNLIEAASDNVIDAKNTVAEAMTQALLRTCPARGCDTQFFKEEGCNKMTCPKCRVLSCYVCRKQIKDYKHFSSSAKGAPIKDGKCPLFDDSLERNKRDVSQAMDSAVEMAKRKHLEDGQELDVSDLKDSSKKRTKRVVSDNNLGPRMRHYQNQPRARPAAPEILPGLFLPARDDVAPLEVRKTRRPGPFLQPQRPGPFMQDHGPGLFLQPQRPGPFLQAQDDVAALEVRKTRRTRKPSGPGLHMRATDAVDAFIQGVARGNPEDILGLNLGILSRGNPEDVLGLNPAASRKTPFIASPTERRDGQAITRKQGTSSKDTPILVDLSGPAENAVASSSRTTRGNSRKIVPVVNLLSSPDHPPSFSVPVVVDLVSDDEEAVGADTARRRKGKQKCYC
ncbi:MAG: hypothetical protein SGCHY_000705, partial [Lobulomycetales sp.]